MVRKVAVWSAGRPWAAGFAVLGSLTCSGDSSGLDPNAVASVTVTPASGSLDTGDSLTLSAVARNARGDALPAASIAWTSRDTAVAIVSATGVTHGIWPGTARIVATSEGKADTARLDVAARITSIALSPVLDTLASLGDELSLSLQAFIGTRAHTGGAYTWMLSDTMVARLVTGGSAALSAQLVARANGTTWVRVREARGAEDSAVVVVRQRVASVALTPASAYRACPVSLVARPLDARGNLVVDAAVTWSVSDTTRAAVDAAGRLTPRAVGSVTVTATAGGVSGPAVVTIAAAPPFSLEVIGAANYVSTVGVAQYAAGRGVSPVSVAAPATFTVTSSDTTRLATVPGQVAIDPLANQVGGIRLVGRSPGAVTLTPVVCDVPGPAVVVTVTPPQLFLLHSLPSEARTDDLPGFDYVNTGDSTGAPQYPAEPLTVRLRSTDSTVLRADPAIQRLTAGVAQSGITVRWVGPGVARLVAEDSAGRYRPDTSPAIRVVYPPLALFGDTLRLGMRQRYTGTVAVDRVVSGAPLRVHVTSTDTTTVRVTPDAVDIAVGSYGAAVQTVGGDTVGTSVVSATAAGRTAAQSVVVVGTPRVQIVSLFDLGLPHYQGDLPGQVLVSAGLAPPVEDVTFTIASSDPAVLSVDSTTLTIRAGQPASAPVTVRFQGPGSAVLTASDPRTAFYRYAPDTTPPVTVVERRLQFDETVVTLGPGQQRGLGIRVAGALASDLVVSVGHTNPAAVRLSDTVAVVANSSRYGAVLATAVSAGVDTVVVSAPGWLPDTVLVVVGTGGVVLVGAGDIADCNTEADEATARLLDSIAGTVFTAGDNVYPNGTAGQFATCYDPTWGRHRARTRPSPGNHDYNTSGAAPYYAYFGDAAGPAGRGYYSYDLGAWHIVSLNSNVAMTVGSAQEQWLRADLAGNTARCTLAYWHHPRFSSGSHGSSTDLVPLWQALYAADADVVLVGHDHNYQRFAPQTPAGVRDDARGIREFVVGTGGRDLYQFTTPIANTEVSNTDTHGVLKLTLYADWYAWEFIPVAGGTFRDSGVGTCH